MIIPPAPPPLDFHRLKFRLNSGDAVNDEVQPTLITVENCPHCGYKRERDERKGDFVHEKTVSCPKCSAVMEITAIYVKPIHRVSSRVSNIAIVLLTAFFFLLTFSRIGDIAHLYFDEPVYVRAGVVLAQFMAPGSQVLTIHPPLAQIIIGEGVLLFGQNPVGWRLLDTIFSTLTIPLLYLFARRLFGQGLVSLLPPVLLTFDFMHFVLAKLAILDGIFLFFIVLMQYAFYLFYSDVKTHADSRSNFRLVFASVATGLAIAAKWPAAFSLLGFGIVFVYLTWQRYRRSRAHRIPVRTILYPILAGILGLIIVCAVYLFTWLPYVVGGWSFNQVLYWQTYIYQFQTTTTSLRTYAFDSRWWSWPLMTIPIPFIFRYTNTVREILLMGNPAIWWTTYPLLALSAYQVLVKRTEKLTYLLLGFLSAWLPFALLSRFQIIYYFYASLPMLILIMSFWLQFALRWKPGKIIVTAYIAVIVILFALFYPALTAEPISRDLAEKLRWLPTWGLY
jgi:dolichyl-phosphate-mannose-protein mannosyltransferase